MSSSIRNRRILLTDGNAPAALAVLRSLGEAGAHVTLAWPEGELRPDGCWSRHGHALDRHPDPWGEQNRFLEWLVDGVAAKKWDVILPLGEASVVAVSRLRRRLPEGAIYAIPPDPSLEYAIGRQRAARLADSLGIAVAQTVFVSDGDASQTWNQDFGAMCFPIAIRIDPTLGPDGAYIRGRDLVAEDADQARTILRELAGVRAGIIAQEFVPGAGFEAAFLRAGGEWPLAFAQRRLHEVPWTGGPASLAVSYRSPKLLDLGRRILEGAGYEGAAMVEFRLSARNNKFCFVRIVGHFWDSLELALQAGVDFPTVYLERLFQDQAARKSRGKAAAPVSASDPVLTADYRTGLLCRSCIPGEIGYLASVFKAKPVRSGPRPPAKIKAVAEAIALTFDPRVRHAHLRWSDPLPGVAAAARSAASIFRRRAVGR